MALSAEMGMLRSAASFPVVEEHSVGGREKLLEPLSLPLAPGASECCRRPSPLSRTRAPCRQPLRRHVTPREAHVPAAGCIVPTLPSRQSRFRISRVLPLSWPPGPRPFLQLLPSLPTAHRVLLRRLFQSQAGVRGYLCRPLGLSVQRACSLSLPAGPREFMQN